MNMPPRWARFLLNHGIEATHWSVEGDMRTPDSEVLRWARENGSIVLTHDLDFGVLLSMIARQDQGSFRSALKT